MVQTTRLTGVAVVGLLLLGGGCGNRDIYPVSGRVVDRNGDPIPGLKGGAVEFESLEARSSASGDIQEDGSFRMTTERPGDGAWLGRHRVLIARPYHEPDRPVPCVIQRKYEDYDTSELEVVVEPKQNVITLKVERLGAGKGDR